MTVSRVINAQTNIKESTRQRVLDVIAELGYQPSSTARALASGHSRRIGVVVDAADHYGPKSMLLAIERAAREVGSASRRSRSRVTRRPRRARRLLSSPSTRSTRCA
jgi:DNA-binding LacI/PurR family transcriptional regulator